MKRFIRRIRSACVALFGPEPIDSSITNCYVKSRGEEGFVFQNGPDGPVIRIDGYAIIPIEEWHFPEVWAITSEFEICDNVTINNHFTEIEDA